METLEKYGAAYIKGKVGMVLGTEIPWLEGDLLNAGAKKIITAEYRTIISKDPRVVIHHPVDTAKKFIASEHELADWIFTFSSLEHDGLGF